MLDWIARTDDGANNVAMAWLALLLFVPNALPQGTGESAAQLGRADMSADLRLLERSLIADLPPKSAARAHEISELRAEIESRVTEVDTVSHFAELVAQFIAELHDGAAKIEAPGISPQWGGVDVRDASNPLFSFFRSPWVSGLVSSQQGLIIDPGSSLGTLLVGNYGNTVDMFGYRLVSVDGASLDASLSRAESLVLASSRHARRSIALARLAHGLKQGQELLVESPKHELRTIVLRDALRAQGEDSEAGWRSHFLPLFEDSPFDGRLGMPIVAWNAWNGLLEPSTSEPVNVHYLELQSLRPPQITREAHGSTPESQEAVAVAASVVHRAIVRASDRPILVMDLRGNCGGNERLASAIAAEFISGSFVFARLEPASKRAAASETLMGGSEGHEAVFTGRLILVVDETCTGPAEMLVGALVDLRSNVVVVGRTTHGCCLHSQHLVTLDHSQVSVETGTAIAVRPGGRVIDGHGIDPDVTVEPMRQDLVGYLDPFLKAALLVADR